MPEDLRPVEGWQVLTAQDLVDFERASKALREQLSRTEAPLDEQVRMRLAKARAKIGKRKREKPIAVGCLPYALLLIVALGVGIAGESWWALALLVLAVAGWIVTNWIW